MIERQSPAFAGRTYLLEPIILSGKSFGIRLLSVYDFMRCELMYRKLFSTLLSQNMNSKLCESICDKACIAAMCLYKDQGQKVFKDGLDALVKLTPDELQKIYEEYIKLYNKVKKSDQTAYSILERIKKGEISS